MRLACGPSRDHAVQIGRHRAGRAGLLADQAEVADFHRLRRIAEIEHLGHAARRASLHAGDEVGDAGVAFPPALVRVLEVPAHARDEARACRIGDVPDLVALAAERAQQIDLVGIALRQRLAVADAHHLRRRPARKPFLAGNVGEVFRLRRIGHVDDRGAVELGLAGQSD